VPDATTLGTLTLVPAASALDLVADPVRAALLAHPDVLDAVRLTAIDPEVSDTPTLVDVHGVPAEMCANCVVVAGRREGDERIAACLVLATTRADVNGVVKRLLDVRKASFLPMDRAVGETGMEYGGITPVGLPSTWRLLVDSRVAATPLVLIGSGVRASKLLLPGSAFAALGAEIVEGLATPVA